MFFAPFSSALLSEKFKKLFPKHNLAPELLYKAGAASIVGMSTPRTPLSKTRNNSSPKPMSLFFSSMTPSIVDLEFTKPMFYPNNGLDFPMEANNGFDNPIIEKLTNKHLYDLRRGMATDEEREEVMRLKRKEQAFKTALCDAFRKTGTCSYGEICRFAHGEQELRLPQQVRGRAHPKYKTQLCDKFSQFGWCPYGPRCQFIHKLKKGLPLVEYDRLLSNGNISPARDFEVELVDQSPVKPINTGWQDLRLDVPPPAMLKNRHGRDIKNPQRLAMQMPRDGHADWVDPVVVGEARRMALQRMLQQAVRREEEEKHHSEQFSDADLFAQMDCGSIGRSLSFESLEADKENGTLEEHNAIGQAFGMQHPDLLLPREDKKTYSKSVFFDNSFSSLDNKPKPLASLFDSGDLFDIPTIGLNFFQNLNFDSPSSIASFDNSSDSRSFWSPNQTLALSGSNVSLPK